MPVKTINVEPIELKWSTSMTTSAFVDEAFEYLNSEIRAQLIPVLAELKEKKGYNFTNPQAESTKKGGLTFLENVDNTPVLIQISLDDDIEKVKFYAKSKVGMNEPIVEYCSLENVTIDYIEAFITVAINHYLTENYKPNEDNKEEADIILKTF